MKINLQSADLPGGWVGAPYSADPSDAANRATLLQCVGGRNTDSDKTGEAHSQDYSLADATISSQASSYRSQDDLTADIAIIGSPKISSCYDQLVRGQISASLPAGTTVNSVSFMIAAGAGGGPGNVIGTGTGTINVTSSGQTADVYLNVAFITGPLIEAEIDFENVDQPVPADTRSALIAKIAARASTG